MAYDLIDQLEGQKQAAAALSREKTQALQTEITRQFEAADSAEKFNIFLHLGDRHIPSWEYISRFGAVVRHHLRFTTCQKRNIDLTIREFNTLAEYEQELAQHAGDPLTQFYILLDVESTNLRNGFAKKEYLHHHPITEQYPDFVAFAKRARATGLFN